MKNTYCRPIADIIPVSTTLLAGSGPRGGDSSLPMVNGEESEEEINCYPTKSYIWDTDEMEN